MLILYWKVVEELDSGQMPDLSAENIKETIQALEELAKLKGDK